MIADAPVRRITPSDAAPAVRRSFGDAGSVPVTVVIPTLNEADRLPACLASISWADEIIVVDAGSTDGTRDLAMAFGARLLTCVGQTIADQKNVAIAEASHPWILSVDADEQVSPELATSIRNTIANPTATAYRVLLRNRYLGAPLDRGDWARDRHIRLYPKTSYWTSQQVHERLVVDGTIGELEGRLEHDSYRDLAHQLEKGLRYARWGAEDLIKKGKVVGLKQVVLHPIWRFCKTYLLHGIWREGVRGFVFCAVHAWCAFTKYALVWDAQRRR